ncbi:MAG: hypothetical protein WEB13_10095, partial [Dehalococcoidia bacterium]
MLRPSSREWTLLGRRRFLALSAGGVAAALIGVACSDDDDDPPAAPTAAATTPAGTPATAPATETATPAAAATTAAQPEQGQVLVGDVLEHALSSDEWSGEFGFVQFRLHPAFVEGDDAYFIRTDTSDEDFARSEQLVFVPKLAKALDAGVGFGDLYLVEGGVTEQRAVLSSAPHREDFSPLFRLHRVTFSGAATLLDSADAVRQAEAEGAADVEATD